MYQIVVYTFLMMIIHLYSIHYFLTIIYHCLALLMPLTTKVNSLTVITIWQFSRLEKEHNNHNNEQEKSFVSNVEALPKISNYFN